MSEFACTSQHSMAATNAADVDAVMSELMMVIAKTRMAFVSDQAIHDANLVAVLERVLSPVVESLGDIGTMSGANICTRIQAVIDSGIDYSGIVVAGLTALAKIVRLIGSDSALCDQNIKYVRDHDAFVYRQYADSPNTCDIGAAACELVFQCIDIRAEQSADSTVLALDACTIASFHAPHPSLHVAWRIVRAVQPGPVEDAVVKYMTDKISCGRVRRVDEAVWMLDVLREFVQSRTDDRSRGAIEGLCNAMLMALGNKAALVDIGVLRVLTAVFAKLPTTCGSTFELFMHLLVRNGFSRPRDSGHNAVFLDTLYMQLCTPRFATNLHTRYDCRPMRKALFKDIVKYACNAIATLHPSDNRCSYSFNCLRFILDDVARSAPSGEFGTNDSAQMQTVRVIRECAEQFNNAETPSLDPFVSASVITEDTPEARANALHTVPDLNNTAIRRYILANHSSDTVKAWVARFDLADELPLNAFSELLWCTGIPNDPGEISRLGDILGQLYAEHKPHDSRTDEFWAHVAKFIMHVERHRALVNTSPQAHGAIQTHLDNANKWAASANDQWLNGLWTEISERGLFSVSHVMRASIHVCERRRRMLPEQPQYECPSRAAVDAMKEFVCSEVTQTAAKAFNRAEPVAGRSVLVKCSDLIKRCVVMADPATFQPDEVLSLVLEPRPREHKRLFALDFVCSILDVHSTAITNWRLIVLFLCETCNAQSILRSIDGTFSRRTQAATPPRDESPSSQVPVAAPSLFGRLAGAVITALQNAEVGDEYEYDEEDFVNTATTESKKSMGDAIRLAEEKAESIIAKVASLDKPAAELFIGECCATLKSPVQLIVAAKTASLMDTPPWNEICACMAAGMASAKEDVQRIAAMCTVFLCRFATKDTPLRMRDMFRQVVAVSGSRQIPATASSILCALSGLLGEQGMNMLVAADGAVPEMDLFCKVAPGTPKAGPVKLVLAAVRRHSSTVDNDTFGLCASAVAACWTADESYVDIVCAILHENSARLVAAGLLIPRLLMSYKACTDSTRTRIADFLKDLLTRLSSSLGIDTRVALFVDQVVPGMRQVVDALDDAANMRLAELVNAVVPVLATEMSSDDEQQRKQKTALLESAVRIMMDIVPDSKTAPPSPLDSEAMKLLNNAMATSRLLSHKDTTSEEQARWNSVWQIVGAKRKDILTSILGDIPAAVSVTI